MNELSQNLKTPLVELLLSIADDKFFLGHRDSDWTGLAPILEEDIAFSSMAQDEISHASALYDFIAKLTNDDANRLAYGRRPEEYRCAALTYVDDGSDWAFALARQFVCDHHDILRLERLSHCAIGELAALASRLLAEERIHVGHADAWIIRLGHGGADARERMQAALDRVAPLASELLEPPGGVDVLERADLYPVLFDDMFERWAGELENVVQEADLALSIAKPAAGCAGGRSGKCLPEFATVLDELTAVYRLEPRGQW